MLPVSLAVPRVWVAALWFSFAGLAHANSQGTVEARNALRTLNEAPVYREANRGYELEQLDQDCDVFGPECVALLEQDPKSVSEALADHPAFWAAYWRYLPTGPIGVDPGLPNPAFYQQYDVSRMFYAAQYWPLRDTLTSGHLIAEHVQAHVNGAKRLAALSATLMDRMISEALYAMAAAPLNRAMFEAVKRDDTSALTRLRSVSQPRTPQERSLATMMQGELAYISGQVELIPKEPEAYLAYEEALWSTVQDAELRASLPKPSLRNWAEVETEHREGMESLAEMRGDAPGLVARSEGTLTEMYEGLVDAGGYEVYLKEVVRIDLLFHVLATLGAVYAGETVAEAPATAAPKGWEWMYDTDAGALCLSRVGLEVDDVPVCMPVWR